MNTSKNTFHQISKKIRNADYYLKRVLDYSIASFLVVTFIPLFITIAIAIKLDSPGKVFFRQTRVGINGKHFQIWKFRTMKNNSEQLQKELEKLNEIEGGIIFKMKKDPRITKVGKFLRYYSLDEIPQLFNILTGDMSLIGPRPLPLRDIEKMDSSLDIRHCLLPGISGLSQVNGRSQNSSYEFFYWDEVYVKQWSIWLDLRIFMMTIPAILTKKGAF